MHTNFPSNGLDSGELHPNQTGYNWMVGQWLATIENLLLSRL